MTHINCTHCALHLRTFYVIRLDYHDNREVEPTGIGKLQCKHYNALKNKHS